MHAHTHAQNERERARERERAHERARERERERERDYQSFILYSIINEHNKCIFQNYQGYDPICQEIVYL